MIVSGKAKLAGVIGWPIAHSLSPRLHGYWLDAHAVDGAYVPLAVPREDFARVIESLRVSGFAGVNVTVPHKEAAFAIAHVLDETALAAGAVNLLLFRNGRIEGRNTDAGGLAASLTEALMKNALAGKDAVLLGSGGAARAAVLALAELGVREVRIVARDHARGENLVREFSARTKTPLRAMDCRDTLSSEFSPCTSFERSPRSDESMSSTRASRLCRHERTRRPRQSPPCGRWRRS